MKRKTEFTTGRKKRNSHKILQRTVRRHIISNTQVTFLSDLGILTEEKIREYSANSKK